MPGATIADETDKTLAFLDAIINADESTTVGDIRGFIEEGFYAGIPDFSVIPV